MQFVSTRNTNTKYSSAQAILQGIAPDGGLFVPLEFPRVKPETLAGMEYCEVAETILRLFLTDYDPAFLKQATKEVYGNKAGKFGEKAGFVRKVTQNCYALELWHGPTCAFKDYALQMMPRLLAQARKMLNVQNTTRILVATSGDTGKAALEGYRDLQGIEIQVFYPTGGTSEIQRLQMTTQQGNNVSVFAVNGNFDDAQTGVKNVFADKQLNERLQQQKVSLSSANSINWGRLVPQIVYYFYAYLRLAEQNAIKMGQEIEFCVPTGNFGDILAGWYAKQMGLPVKKLICASNKNNVLTEFFETGRYNAKRTFFKTTSPSMDILVSSNLERLLYHISGENADLVSDLMNRLSQNGEYRISQPLLEKIRRDFAADFADDCQAAQEICRQWQNNKYLCDPHTAVAFCAADKKSTPEHCCVVLSTASPYKFAMPVLQALGQTLPADEFEAIRLLQKLTQTQPPKQLEQLEHLPERFSKAIEPQQIAQAAQKRILAQ